MKLFMLQTSNFYSILYYNSEIWSLQILSPQLEQLIISGSANALKLTQKIPNRMQSFVDIHVECNCVPPEQMILYKHAIVLYKTISLESTEIEWITLIFWQTKWLRLLACYCSILHLLASRFFPLWDCRLNMFLYLQQR